jgi:REP element-mobilizing transposase RayT
VVAEGSPLICSDVEGLLWALIAAQYKRLDATALRVGGMPEHVQPLVTHPPSLALSKLVGEVKGAPSHAMTHTLAPRHAFRWQDCYVAFSLCKRDAPSWSVWSPIGNGTTRRTSYRRTSKPPSSYFRSRLQPALSA